MKTQFRAALILFNYCPYIIVYAIYVICNYYIVPSCTNTVESRIAIVISHQGILISSSILPVKILNYTNIVPNFPNAILDFPDRFSFPPLSKVPSRQSGSLCWVTDPLSLTPSSSPIHRRALLPLKHSHFHDRILSLHNH